MSVQESAKTTLLPSLAKWLILGVFILTFRFLRWGGVLGLLGIAAFVGSIWLAFRLADPVTNELTSGESVGLLALLIAGVALYIAGVVYRRRRKRPQPEAIPD